MKGIPHHLIRKFLFKGNFFKKNKIAKVIGAVVATFLLAQFNEYLNTADFEYENKKIVYTEHSRCRMSCRSISKNEIKQVLEQGRINKRKSDNNAKPCPSLSIEKRTKGQRIRVVLGDCSNKYMVLTVIDLDGKHDCNCR